MNQCNINLPSSVNARVVRTITSLQGDGENHSIFYTHSHSEFLPDMSLVTLLLCAFLYVNAGMDGRSVLFACKDK